MSLSTLRSALAVKTARLFPLCDSSVLAEPWRRLLAATIDTSLLFLVHIALVGLALSYCSMSDRFEMLEVIGSTLVCWIYVLVGWSLGATIGMRSVGIRIVGEDMSRIGFRTALLRTGGFVLASLPVKFGLLPILYDDRRQGWHDRLARTLVVKASTAAGDVVPTRRPQPLLPAPPLPDFSVPKRSAWAVLLFYATIVIALTWPTAAHLSTRIMGQPRDPYIFMWNYWYFLYALKSHISPLHTNLIFYPHDVSLALHTMQWFNCLLAAPLQHWLNLTSIYNLLNLFSMTTSAFALYWMTAAIVGRRLPALIAGLIYGASPYFQAHAMGHANLVAAEFIPLYVLCAYAALVTSQARYAIWAGVWLALSGLCDLQYLAFDVFFGGAMYIALWLLFERPDRALMYRRAKLLLGTIAIAGVLLLPIAAPAVRGVSGRGQDKSRAAAMFRVDLADWVKPGIGSRVFGQHFKPEAAVEESVTPGLTMLALAVLGAVLFWSISRFWCWLALFFIVLACGPYLTIHGFNCNLAEYLITGFPGSGFGLPWQTEGLIYNAGVVVTDPKMLGADTLRIVMPFSWLAQAIPLMHPFRVPARFAVLVLMCISVLAGLGIKGSLDYVRRRSILGTGLAAAVMAALILVEYFCAPFPSYAPPKLPYYVLLGRDSTPGALIEQPLTGNELSAYGQIFHHKPLFKSFISRMPDGALDLANNNAFLGRGEHIGQAGGIASSQAGLMQLRQLGARYVVFKLTGDEHADRHDCLVFEQISHAPLVYADNNTRAYRLDAR